MHISRLAVAALLVASVSVAAPADAAKRHPVKRHAKVAKVVKVAPEVAATTVAQSGYQHVDELDFTAGANRKPLGSSLPVLADYQHCSGFFVPQVIPYFNGPVLVCG